MVFISVNPKVLPDTSNIANIRIIIGIKIPPQTDNNRRLILFLYSDFLATTLEAQLSMHRNLILNIVSPNRPVGRHFDVYTSSSN